MEAITTAGETRDQFLQLLVTQLRYQDPLEPTKQEDFLGQLAQFSTLEGIEKLNANLDGFLTSQLDSQSQQNQLLAELQQFQSMAGAASLVGKTVEFRNEPDQTQQGVVEAVVIQHDLVSLRVNGELVALQDVLEIGRPAGLSDVPLGEAPSVVEAAELDEDGDIDPP